MRGKLLLLVGLLLIEMAFSQTVETPPYLKMIGKFFEILFKVAAKGGNLSVSFYIILLIIGIAVFLILRNAAYKFLEGAVGDEKQANAIATLLALAITFLTFSNTNILLAILAIAATPLSVYFIIALIFGAIGAFWVGWDRAWGAAAFVAFLGLFVIYNWVPIDVQSLNKIAGTNFQEEYLTPWQAMEKISPGLGTTFGIVFFFGIIIMAGYFFIGVLLGKAGGGG